MLRQNFDIPLYDWNTTIFYGVEKRDAREILRELQYLGCKDEHLQKAKKMLKKAEKNSGFTISSFFDKQTIIVVFAVSSIGEFLNTLTHEKNHLEMHICTAMGIEPESEEASYLSGDIAQIMYKDVIAYIFGETEKRD